jgi:hypothetical protein
MRADAIVEIAIKYLNLLYLTGIIRVAPADSP